jgi:hypothetical protein
MEGKRMRLRSNGSRTAHQPPARLDGLGQWRKTLDRYVWFLRRAGIPSSAITTASATSLRRHRKVRALAVPPLAVLLYSSVLTYWQNELRYLDGEGNPKPLSRTGRNGFRTLVRDALGGANPEHVLTVLARHRVISQDIGGNIHLLERALVPRLPQQRAHSLGYALMAIEAVIDTCYATLHASRPSQDRNRVQRIAYSENFDPRFLDEYDKFQRESVRAFLDSHDAWLKRHEIKEPKRRNVRRYLIGINVNGILPRPY